MDPNFPPTPRPTTDLGVTDLRYNGIAAAVMVECGAALTLDRVLHAGRTIALNHATAAITLCAALGTGARFRFVVTLAGAPTLACTPTTDFFFGVVFINDAGDTSAATADAYPTASNSNKFTGAVAGGFGRVGDVIEIQDFAAGKWEIKGFSGSATDPVTPFSNV